MAKNMKIRRGNDGFSYPYTSPDLVVDENGKSATTKFNELEAKIGTGSGTSIDDVNTSTDKTWSSSKIDSQFKDIANKTCYISDESVGNNIPMNIFFSLSQIKSKQNYLLALFFKKMRTYKENVTICCLGDSTTYGHDVKSSDIRPAMSDVLYDQTGGNNTFTQASTTYPEALKNYLSEVFDNQPDKISVINRGFSGDWAKKSYERWKTSCGSNLTIISLGINDSQADYVEKPGDIEEYLCWYEKIICREILRDSAVIILTPFKQKSPTNINVDTFSNALQLLGEKYGIPVVIGDTFLANHEYKIFSDSLHLNGDGYKIIGAKVSAFLLGEGIQHPNIVTSGTKLLTRQTLDNITLRGCAFVEGEGYGTPNEISDGKGIAIQFNSNGNRVYYSFYCDSEDLLLLPDVYINNSDIKITLDFDTVTPRFSLNSLVSKKYTFDDTLFPRKEFTISSSAENTYSRGIRDMDDYYIHIANKGWHTVKIELTKIGGGALLRGIEFINYDLYNMNKATNDVKKLVKKDYIIKDTHPSLDDTSSITSIDINVIDVIEKLGLPMITDDWRNGYPVRFRILNQKQSIIDYYIIFGNIYQKYGWDLAFSSNQIKLKETIDSGAEMIIDSINYNQDTKILTLNFNGRINKNAKIIISI